MLLPVASVYLLGAIFSAAAVRGVWALPSSTLGAAVTTQHLAPFSLQQQQQQPHQQRQRQLSTHSRSRRPEAIVRAQKRNAAGLLRGFNSSAKGKQREALRDPPSFAFAFDIDGVLLHVSKPIPGATETLRFLNEHNIPFILLTNGGGKLEADRVKDLSEKLGVPLATDNFVQSHTPFRELVDAGGPDGKGFRDKTILVTGSDYEKCRSIAESYGFQNVVTPADILAAHRSVFPFAVVADVESSAGDGDKLATRPLPKPLHNTTAAPATAAERAGLLKIDAMFVLNDPRDWALDIQVLADLLLSEQGYMGTYSSKNGNASLLNHGWQRDGQPTLYFSNADLLWAAAYHLPRFGQGAFQAALAGVWHRLTNGTAPLRRTVIGKPHADTYRFAERVLTAHRNDTLRRLGHLPEQAAESQCAAAAADSNSNPIAAVYMVGDNPESDIAGANGHVSDAGTQWLSALVRTGVWSEERDGHGVLTGVKKPTVVVPDVKAAVQWALQREGWYADF